MSRPKMQVEFKNTRFVPFIKTNFQGDPERGGKFHSTARQAYIMIPDQELALRMRADGFNIKETRPQDEEDDFTPDYYVAVKLNFNKPYPEAPAVHVILVTPEGARVELDEESINLIDELFDSKSIRSVTALCNMSFRNEGNNVLYIQEMTVEQSMENDPYRNYLRYN